MNTLIRLGAWIAIFANMSAAFNDSNWYAGMLCIVLMGTFAYLCEAEDQRDRAIRLLQKMYDALEPLDKNVTK